MIDKTIVSEVIFIALQTLSIGACSLFIYSNREFSNKTLALTMISLLNVTNLLFHFVILAVTLLGSLFEDKLNFIQRVIVDSILKFSIFWACGISFVVYRSLLRHGIVKPGMFFQRSIGGALLFTLVFTALWELLDVPDPHKQLYTSALPILLCFLFSSTCYLRSLQIVSGYPNELQNCMRVTIKKLFIYPLVQIIATVPTMVFVAVRAFSVIDPPEESRFIFSIPISMIGLVNALIYFIQMKSDQNLQKSADVLVDINNTLSFNNNESYESTDQSKSVF